MQRIGFSRLFIRRAPLLASALLLYGVSSWGQDTPEIVTTVSWGGQYQKALFEDWILPRAKSLGVTVRGQSYSGEYKTITEMVQSGTVTWDLVQVETFYAALARDLGILEKFDPPVSPGRISLPLQIQTLQDYAFPTIGWSYVLAWNHDVLTSRLQESREPNSWNDLWNYRQFPGQRALRDTPQGNIEIALLADGLTKEQIVEQLYKQHDFSLVDRAFRKLDEIRDQTIWWESGDQLQRELETGRATLVAAWNGRVWLARHKPITRPNTTFDIRLTFKDAILDHDWWIIPKGAPNAKVAAKLVNALYDDINGAIKFARSLGYGPPIKGWDNQIRREDELYTYMPTTTDNLRDQLPLSPDFWAKHYTELADRWTRWKAK